MSRPTWICSSCRRLRLRLQSRSPRSYQRRTVTQNSRFFRVSEEVQQAVAEHRPVVALESTIYTHGFSYPDNLSLASRLESLVRINGGIPATVGVVDGVARVGMGADELIRLVSSTGQRTTRKVSRRDLALVCGTTNSGGEALNGGTTVSATVVLAHMAGIRIFATGGLGGVHRGVEETMDVSADLTELGRTPVAVISSGCKSFLDIPRTLEYLETQGVTVATFADGRDVRKVDFPAFWSRQSGVKSPAVLQDEREAASVVYAHLTLGLQSGLHLANPIPEQYSIPYQQMEPVIQQALIEANEAGAKGAASTPYILAKIKEITGSKSAEANRALVEANVVRGTRVAVALRKLEMDGMREADSDDHLSPQVTGPAAVNDTSSGVSKGVNASSTLSAEPAAENLLGNANPPEAKSVDIFVAGSLAVDLSCDFNPPTDSASTSPELHTSNPAIIAQSLGGVGRNVARAAHLMGANVRLCSVLGDDLSGKTALEALAASGMSDAGVKVLEKDDQLRTAQYVAVNDRDKNLVVAMADMSILEHHTATSSMGQDIFDTFWLPQLRRARPSHLAIDANWRPEHLARWLEAGKEIEAQVCFEPVSTAKAARLFRHLQPSQLPVYPNAAIHLTTPNALELNAMYHAARASAAFDRQDWWEVIDALGIPHTGARTQLALATSAELVNQGLPQQSIQLLPFIPTICTKLGPQGVLLTQLLPAGDERLSSAEYTPYILSRCATEGTEAACRRRRGVVVGGVYMRLFPAVEDVPAEEVLSVNGLGDTFAGTLIAGLAKMRGEGDKRVEELVDVAQRAAVLTLKSKESVSPGLGTLRILL